MVATSSSPLAAVGDVARIDVRGYGSATLSLEGGAVALAGGTVIIEATNVDNPMQSDFFPVIAAASGSVTGATTTPLWVGALAPGVTLSNAYRINAAGYTYVQARMMARTSGDIVAQWAKDTMPVEPVPAAPAPATTVTVNPPSGTNHNLVTAASTNASNLVAAACNLDELTISNPTATPAFVKLYNKATAPTVGTDVPIVTIPVPANGFVSVPFPNTGKRFATGLGIAVTAGQPATDVAATVAGIVVNLTRH